MPSTRRALLSIFSTVLALVVSGCQTILSNGNKQANTTTNGNVSSPSGNSPPWLRADSNTDIVVRNATVGKINATVTAVGQTTEISIKADQDWVSGDIIPNGESTTVTVSTESGRESETDWSAEEDNSNVLIHVFTDDTIRTHIETKEE